MNKTQMELSFESSLTAATVGGRRQDRSSRARWWFRQMHGIVNCARDWQTTPRPRAEQADPLLVRTRM